MAIFNLISVSRAMDVNEIISLTIIVAMLFGFAGAGCLIRYAISKKDARYDQHLSLQTFLIGCLFLSALMLIYLKRDPWEKCAEVGHPVNLGMSTSSNLTFSKDERQLVLFISDRLYFYDWDGNSGLVMRWWAACKPNLFHTRTLIMSAERAVMHTGIPEKQVRWRPSGEVKAATTDLKEARYFDLNNGEPITDPERNTILQSNIEKYIYPLPPIVDDQGRFQWLPGSSFYELFVSRLRYREYGGQINGKGDRIAYVDGHSDVRLFVPPIDFRAGSMVHSFPVQIGSAARFAKDGECIAIAGIEATYIYRRRFPELWWGHFYRDEIWLAVALCVALIYSGARTRHSAQRKQ